MTMVEPSEEEAEVAAAEKAVYFVPEGPEYQSYIVKSVKEKL